jgi:tetratricopeptide (TPR) repeat protein
MAQNNPPNRDNRRQPPYQNNDADLDQTEVTAPEANAYQYYDDEGSINPATPTAAYANPSYPPIAPTEHYYPAEDYYEDETSALNYAPPPPGTYGGNGANNFDQYGQPTQFTPEGIPPALQNQNSHPTNTAGYYAAPPPPVQGGQPSNIPPHRRSPNYRTYQPIAPGGPPPTNNRPNYRQPLPSEADEYDEPQPYTNVRNRPNWGAAPPPPLADSDRSAAWLIPILVGLLILMIIGGIIVILLLAGKNDTVTNPTAPVVAQVTATQRNVPPTVNTPQTGVASATLAIVGTPLPPTSTPGAGAATQLAQLNSTLTAQVAFNPTPGVGPTLAPIFITATAQALMTAQAPTLNPDSSATATVTATVTSDIDQFYLTGVQAIQQGQWQTAIAALEQVQFSHPNYKDTITLLIQAYTEQGMVSINDAQTVDDVLAARQYFDKALLLKPNDPNIKKLEQELAFYYNGRVQYEASQWQQAINNFASLFKIEPTYKDTVELLYTAYLNQGDLLAGQNHFPEALNDYQNASTLPINDVSLAQQKILQLQALITPSATPFPTITPKPTATPTPPATATPVLVNGCLLGTFNFGPFEQISTGTPTGPDQGKGTVRGVVLDTNHHAIAGAVVRISNSGGSYSFTATTGGDGGYIFANELGRDIWTVKLISAPGVSICFSASASVSVNGQAGTQATVSFVQTHP